MVQITKVIASESISKENKSKEISYQYHLAIVTIVLKFYGIEMSVKYAA